MTVPPASQLTSRIVPASTLRRKDATIMGSTTSTPRTMPAIRIRFDMDGEVEEGVRSGLRQPDGAAVARGVDAGDANDVARADARAARAIVRSEGRQELHDLSIDVQRDQPLAIRVEAHHRSSVVLDRALECRRGGGLEAEEHAPERANKQTLEGGRREDGGAGAPRLAERRGDETTRAETDEQREQHAGREKRVEEVRRALRRVVARAV